MELDEVLRIVYNQVLVDKAQLEHITSFCEMALKHQKPKRRFRIIIEELRTPKFSKNPAENPVDRFR